MDVRAHAVVCGAAVPHLRASGGGAICITASNSALLSEPQLAPYAVDEGRRARARAPGRARLQRRGNPRQRALPGLDRHALQHARVGELRRPRALPGRGSAARAAGTHRHARGGGEARLLPALGRRRVHDRHTRSSPTAARACRAEPRLRCYAHDGIRLPAAAGASLSARQIRAVAGPRGGAAARRARRTRGDARGTLPGAHRRVGSSAR